MTADVLPEDRIRALQAAVHQRQHDKAKAENALAVAQARETAAMQALADEFGVASLDAAAALLKTKEADLDQACAEAEAALKEAGAG